MSNEVKQRKKASALSSKEIKDAPGSVPGSGRRRQDEVPGKAVADSPGGGHRSLCAGLRTLLCVVCVAACMALTWHVFQQSHSFTVIEERYHLLQAKSAALDALEDKVRLIFEKWEETQEAVKKLRDLQLAQHIERLQREIDNIERWSNNISGKRAQLEGNLTNLLQAVTHIEHNTAAVAKDVSVKIAAVKTDVRRISGLGSDVTSLADSVHELESKLEKVEQKTIHTIGDVLAGSIDRVTDLKTSVSRNSERIDLMKKRLTEFQGNFSENSERLLNLESDRLKVIKTVHFANDLKPKVFTLRKDFAHLEPMLNDLTLRLGRLAFDLSTRAREMTLLNEKISNLTAMKSEIIDLSNAMANNL